MIGGKLTPDSEHLPNANGWTKPYLYDGRDGVRYDPADGLNWMAVRAYDPSIGRFLSRERSRLNASVSSASGTFVTS